MATGAATRSAIAPEVTYGTAIVAPTFETLVYLSGGPTMTTDKLQDKSIRADFHNLRPRQGVHKPSGSTKTNFRYGAYDTPIQAILGGTWTDNELGVGSVRRSFLYEKYFGTAIADKPYHRTPGWVWNKMSLQCSANGIITADFDGIGQDTVTAAAAIGSSSYGDPSANEMFTAFDGAITLGAGACATVTSLSLTIERPLGPRYCVGSNLSLEPDAGIVVASGSLEVWFTDNVLVDKYLAGTADLLTLVLTDPTTNALTISLPKIDYFSGVPDVPGDASIPLKLDFEASYDSVTEESILFTRAPYTP